MGFNLGFKGLMEFRLIVSLTGSVFYWYVSMDPTFIGGRLHPSATHDVTIQKTVLCITTAISDVLYLKL